MLAQCLRAHRLLRRRALSSQPPRVPWFVDDHPTLAHPRPPPPHIPPPPTPVPTQTPQFLKLLHAELVQSPLLDPSALAVYQPTPLPLGPPLPLRPAQGRRKKGGTYAGESAYECSSGIWNWIVMAQVKEGTENRGAVEAVVRVVRKSLLTMDPPVMIPNKSRRQMASGWALIDAGNFVIHVMSKEAREKYFMQQREEQW